MLLEAHRRRTKHRVLLVDINPGRSRVAQLWTMLNLLKNAVCWVGSCNRGVAGGVVVVVIFLSFIVFVSFLRISQPHIVRVLGHDDRVQPVQHLRCRPGGCPPRAAPPTRSLLPHHIRRIDNAITQAPSG
jgi:hypothetical protein